MLAIEKIMGRNNSFAGGKRRQTVDPRRSSNHTIHVARSHNAAADGTCR